MTRVSMLIAVIGGLAACAHYEAPTPRAYLEANPENYRRLFGTAIPADVTVVNSVIVEYADRSGVVTHLDYELELLVPTSWVDLEVDRFLHRDQMREEVVERLSLAIRPWFVPRPIEAFWAYRDPSSRGWVHMFVGKEPTPDGRWHVFLSKH
jgi:hypothetical protein